MVDTHKKLFLATAVVAVLFVISACNAAEKSGEVLTPALPVGLLPAATVTPPPEDVGTQASLGEETPPEAHIPPTDSGWIKRGDTASWPAYIPNDIPPFEGKIRLTMEVESHVRIFYEDVTREQIDQYLQLLEKQGFKLEYQVYVQEGFPDNSAERIKKKDWDAVDITKGAYHTNIGYGEGHISYDIYISGFELPQDASTVPTQGTGLTTEAGLTPEAGPAPVGNTWPAEYTYNIPQPERCPLTSVQEVPPKDYIILCQPADQAVVADYRQALEAAGYIPNTILPASDGSLDGSINAWGNIEIKVEQPDDELVVIRIDDTAAKKHAVPTDLTGILPEPQGCTQFLTTPTGDGGVVLTCVSEDPQTRTGYMEALLAAGFAEIDRIQSQNGELVSVMYQKGTLEVKLMLGQLSGMVIYVTGSP